MELTKGFGSWQCKKYVWPGTTVHCDIYYALAESYRNTRLCGC